MAIGVAVAVAVAVGVAVAVAVAVAVGVGVSSAPSELATETVPELPEADAVDAVTVTVPFMKSWISQ